LAKTRKIAKKSASAKKAAGGKKKSAAASKKKTAGKARASAAKPRPLNFRPLKRQLMKTVQRLSGARTTDPRVQNAIASLQRLHAELNANCEPTMTLPLA
jgi:hypothetical protein